MGTGTGPSGSGRRGGNPPPIFKAPAEARRTQREAAKRSKPGTTPVQIAIFAVAVLVGGGVLRACNRSSGDGGVFSFLDRGAAVADPLAWHEESFRRITFESPIALGRDEDMMSEFDAATRAAMAVARKKFGNNSADDFAVVATYFRASGDGPLDPDGATTGGIRGAAQALGAYNVAPVVTSVTVGGRPARRGSATVKSGGKTVMLHAVSVGEGSEMWSVMVVHEGTRAEPDAQRVLESIRFTSEK